MGVDDLALQETRRAEAGKSPSKTGLAGTLEIDASDDDDCGAEGFVQHSVGSLPGRLNAYVKQHLSAASGSRRDDYHDGVAYHAIKALKKSFMGEIQGKTCHSCGAYV